MSVITDVTMSVCSLDAYVQLCYRRPQFGLALSWIAVQEAATYAEHIIDVGRRTPIERLSHFLLELHARLHVVGRAAKTSFALPFSQEVSGSERQVEFLDPGAMQALAHYQPQKLASIPLPAPA